MGALTANIRSLSRVDAFFLMACGLVAFMSWHSLRALVSAVLEQEQDSHTALVLPVVLILLLLERSKESKSPTIDFGGVPIFGIAVVVRVIAHIALPNYRDALSLSILSVVFGWIGIAVFLYGTGVLRRFTFIVLFLFLLIPIPSVLLGPLIRSLQQGSTWASQALFIATGVPVVREGFVLMLPKINIEVATECSGIRSTMMLVLTSLVLGHLFLVSTWRQIVLMVMTILIAILKNALRIFTLSILAIYVDLSWIEGKFHHVYGGTVFFTLALGMVVLLLEPLRPSKHEGCKGKEIS